MNPKKSPLEKFIRKNSLLNPLSSFVIMERFNLLQKLFQRKIERCTLDKLPTKMGIKVSDEKIDKTRKNIQDFLENYVKKGRLEVILENNLNHQIQKKDHEC